MSVLNDLQSAFGKHPVGSSPSMIAFANEAKIKRNYKLLFGAGLVVGGVAVWWIMKRHNEEPAASNNKPDFRFKPKHKEDENKKEETYSSFSGQDESEQNRPLKNKKREKRRQEYLKNLNRNKT